MKREDNYVIKNGRVIDPVNKIDDTLDVAVSAGRIDKIAKDIKSSYEMIDAKGMIVAPGLVDMHVHLREPGREDKETVLTGTRAAVKGGFTAVACMPNTQPPVDTKETVRLLKKIIEKDAVSAVFIIGAITKERAGIELVDFSDMAKEGVAAVSDDGSSVEDEDVMLEALKKSKTNSLLVIAHCEDPKLSGRGLVNRGFISTKTGMREIPAKSEYERVRRDLALAGKASCRIHIAHVSCKESVDLIRKAKHSGLKVTAETAPHYFTLTEDCCVTYDTNTKMNPPLRTKEDTEAIREALKDGTIDAIASDHAPHTDSEKDVEFEFAPFGIIGLESSLGLSIMELVEKGVLTWSELILKMSSNPAKILASKSGSLEKGKPADITIIDPNKEYILTKDSLESKSRNSPFINWRLKGKAAHVFVNGRLVVKDGAIL